MIELKLKPSTNSFKKELKNDGKKSANLKALLFSLCLLLGYMPQGDISSLNLEQIKSLLKNQPAPKYRGEKYDFLDQIFSLFTDLLGGSPTPELEQIPVISKSPFGFFNANRMRPMPGGLDDRHSAKKSIGRI